MVRFHGLLSVDQNSEMAKTMNTTDTCLKLKQINQFYNNKRTSNSPNQLNILACEQSLYAFVDVIISIIVIGACGFLLYPFVKILADEFLELIEEGIDVMREEISNAPMLFGCLGLSILFAAMALVATMVYIERRCGKPGCHGLSDAFEFDIQLETEECVKKTSCIAKSSFKKGLFELPRDHHRELKAELKKMAPPNGRAVLVFQARCGCAIGRMEVMGPKRSQKLKN